MSNSKTAELLREVETLLIATVARITQTSDKKVKVVMGAATNAATGVAAGAGIMGLVGALGTASTGAAIAGLSGAAQTTATLYWIGALVGGGVAAGGVMVGGVALGAGYWGATKIKKLLFGKARDQTVLLEEEIRLLAAIHSLLEAIRASLEGRDGRPFVSYDDLRAFSVIGLSPVLDEIGKALEAGVFRQLTTVQRVRLRGNLYSMQRWTKKVAMA